MEIVLYTQRVEIIKAYGERRDCADQRIPQFIEACGYLPVPIPNVRSTAEQMIRRLRPAGIVLTGGNSLVKYGGDAPERDKTEKALLEAALEQKMPVYGFCRGMQLVLDYFGCRLETVGNHAGTRHEADGLWGKLEVNSYHTLACRELNAPLIMTEQAADGVVEAAAYPEKNIIVTMWHPEREEPFREEDIKRVSDLFG